MGKFSHLNLEWWAELDLEDLDAEFHISEKTPEELDQLATKLYWEAQSLYATVTSLESKSDCIRRYLEMIKK